MKFKTIWNMENVIWRMGYGVWDSGFDKPILGMGSEIERITD